MLTIGDKFPEVFRRSRREPGEGEGVPGAVTSDDYAGKWKVVFFWPKDFTFVCPTEIAAFGKRNARLRRPRRPGAGREHRQRVRPPGLAQEPPRPQGPAVPDAVRPPPRAVDGARHHAPDGRRRDARDLHRRSRGTIRFVSVTDLDVGRNVDEVLRVLDALQTDELCPCNWQKGEPTLEAA